MLVPKKDSSFFLIMFPFFGNERSCEEKRGGASDPPPLLSGGVGRKRGKLFRVGRKPTFVGKKPTKSRKEAYGCGIKTYGGVGFRPTE
jgi:hypothetical protein